MPKLLWSTEMSESLLTHAIARKSAMGSNGFKRATLTDICDAVKACAVAKRGPGATLVSSMVSEAERASDHSRASLTEPSHPVSR